MAARQRSPEALCCQTREECLWLRKRLSIWLTFGCRLPLEARARTHDGQSRFEVLVQGSCTTKISLRAVVNHLTAK